MNEQTALKGKSCHRKKGYNNMMQIKYYQFVKTEKLKRTVKI